VLGVVSYPSLAGRGRPRRGTYPDRVKIGEELFFGGGRRLRVIDVVFDEDDESPFVGLLPVEGA
jgi:hypothetical protein